MPSNNGHDAQVTELLESGITRADVLRKLAAAGRKRRKADALKEESREELAIYSRIGSAIGIPMSDMMERSGFSREMLYVAQREAGFKGRVSGRSKRSA